MKTLNPNQTIAAQDWNDNFGELSDATGIEDAAITATKITSGSWVTPTLLNDWVNYGGSFAIAGYRIDNMGFVHLRGLIKDGSSADEIMFTLPAGYRPDWNILAPVKNSATGKHGGLIITSAGNVSQQTSNGATAYVSLDGISFRADGS
jgi:hypothetical protein